MAKINEAREIRTPNLLIWSQTRCRCAIAPLLWRDFALAHHAERARRREEARRPDFLPPRLARAPLGATWGRRQGRRVWATALQGSLGSAAAPALA